MRRTMLRLTAKWLASAPVDQPSWVFMIPSRCSNSSRFWIKTVMGVPPDSTCWRRPAGGLTQFLLDTCKASKNSGTTCTQPLFLVCLKLAEFRAGKQARHLYAYLIQVEEPLLSLPCFKAETFFILCTDQSFFIRCDYQPSRVPQDAIMVPSRAVLKGGRHFPRFPPAQTVLADRFKQQILVAALQLCQFRSKTRRQKTKPYALLCFVAQPLAGRKPTTNPALVAANQNPNLHLAQTIFMVERMNHQRLLHPGNGSANPIELQHGGLTRPQTSIQRTNRKFGKPQLPASP